MVEPPDREPHDHAVLSATPVILRRPGGMRISPSRRNRVLEALEANDGGSHLVTDVRSRRREIRPHRPSPDPLRSNTMPPINVAVIGSGFMGAAHIDGLRRVPGVDIVAIASVDRPRAQELAEQFGIPHVLEDWRALLDRPDDGRGRCAPRPPAR